MNDDWSDEGGHARGSVGTEEEGTNLGFYCPQGTEKTGEDRDRMRWHVRKDDPEKIRCPGALSTAG